MALKEPAFCMFCKVKSISYMQKYKLYNIDWISNDFLLNCSIINNVIFFNGFIWLKRQEKVFIICFQTIIKQLN